ncbi:MAG: hypothetical protein VXW65_11090, partial [Pseudomonadota bacterium]|nr:hypothetical protein [Pseudomonadota bacterium]
ALCTCVNILLSPEIQPVKRRTVFHQLWPSRCALCHIQPALPQQALCIGCHHDLPWRLDRLTLPDLEVMVVFEYVWPIDRLLHLFKYQQRLELLKIFEHGLKHLPRPEVDALVAMPAAHARLRERGYNQAQLLAQSASQHWQIPLWSGVQRKRHTDRQQQLNRTQRIANLTHAFAAQSCPPPRLLLIDDVLTTGTTLRTLAYALQSAGTAELQAMVIASAKSA